MFTARDLPEPLDAIRDAHAPDAVVVDCASNFETLPPAQAEQLGLVVEALDPASYPAEWVPADAPELLARYASGEFTVGMPGDGSVAWTRQTDPPVVLVKPRAEESPDAFREFLLAEALVQVGLAAPEQFLPFFGERYPDFAAVSPLDAAETYQVAAACYDAYLGLATRDVFAGWAEEYPDLFAAWVDAGERLEPRLAELPAAVAAGRTSFGDAAELACSAIKHAVEVPAPFDALDDDAYREGGADYALAWAERAFEALA
jgi:hypothetical protein